jgi:hypothetical protein
MVAARRPGDRLGWPGVDSLQLGQPDASPSTHGLYPRAWAERNLTELRGFCNLQTTGVVAKGSHMKLLKSQAFRVLLALSALASSAIVLEAGKRW